MKCKICGNAEHNRPITLYEFMYGTREPFEYFTCANCGCLQITSVPEDLAKYYPGDYYSYSAAGPGRTPGFFSREKYRAIFFGKGLLGRGLDSAKPDANGEFRCFQRVQLHKQSRILDVGCGSGRSLVKMREHGFVNLMGVDPYLPETIDYGSGLMIRRMSLSEVDGSWDVITFQHVFEHLTEPLEALRHVRRLLAPGGSCIVRIPVVPCEAFDRYGVHWFQLDAPRHLYLHSQQSMELLAGQAGLRLDRSRTYYDSIGNQFWGSELYRRGITLADGAANLKAYFKKDELQGFKKEAQTLNRTQRGDQAVFYLALG
jgi:2-polyprenyl-3-methyl-5-hydroxy-6-metoxy-1,4-benzoquinol methylase